MNYKALFQIAMSLISSPAKAWEEIRLEDRRAVLTVFVYPMIGLCGLSVFIGALWTNGWGGPQSFQLAMTQCCAVAVALFGGYFLAAYAINQMGIKMFGMTNDIPLAQQFAGYALVVTFLLHIVTGLLPDFSIIGWLLQFYIVYVGSKGCDAGRRKESVALHHFLVDFVNTMSGGNTSCVQQANSYIKLRK